jgi:nucleoid DNA-binding protein
MNRSQLIERVCAAYDAAYPWQRLQPHPIADFAIRTAFEEIMRALERGETVSIRGFGRWEIRRRRERSLYNVNSQERTTIPTKNLVRFTGARSDPIGKIENDPFAVPEHFESAEHLVGWLTTAAGAIDCWDTWMKASAAWSATKEARSKMLSVDEHRSLAAIMKEQMNAFEERWTRNLHQDPDYWAWLANGQQH